MYGWYELTGGGVYEIRFLSWFLRGGLPALTPADRTLRLDRLTAKLATAFPGADHAQLRELAKTKTFMCLLHLPEIIDVDFAICMSVEFFRHHQGDAAAALAGIDALINRQFGPVNSETSSADVFRLVGHLKGVAFLMPGAGRESTIRAACGDLRRSIIRNLKPDQDPGTELSGAAAIWKECDSALRPLSRRAYKSACTIMEQALFTCEADELKKTGDEVKRLIRNNRFGSLAAPLFNAIIDRDDLTPAYSGRAALTAVTLADKQWTDVGPDGVVREAIADAVMAQFREYDELKRATDAAIDADVDFGPRTADNKKARAATRARQIERKAATLSALVAGDEQPAGESTDSPDRRADLQQWSLERLAEWIDGPVFGPHQKRFDRARVVQRVNQDAQARRAARPVAVQPAEEVELTEDEFAKVERSGLRGAAEFFACELADTIALAKQMNVDAAAIQTCAVLVGPIDETIATLDHAPDELELLAIQTRLGNTEAALDTLRREIKGAQAQASLKARFDAEFRFALSREPLEPGRREGARIACPLTNDDWAWVYAKYHGCLLPQRSLMEGRTRMPLPPHQALAIYVTQRSDSGHAFDLSVHLWQRIAGSNAPAGQPSLGPDELPLMNRNAWFDTYVTCCVLHVQRGKPRPAAKK